MRLRQKITLFLLVVYAFFFASANLCYHTHQLADGTIVHSHIFWGGKTHNHTSGQLQIVDQINTVIYDYAESVFVQQYSPEYSERLFVAREVAAQVLASLYSFSLRAPPVA